MASVNSLNTGTFYGVSSGFFNSMFGTSSSQASVSSAIYDYGSIKNGSYYKLLKSYYNGNAKLDSVAAQSTEKNSAAEDKKTVATVRDNAKSLKEDALALLEKGSKSVFNKKDIKNEDGTTALGYDKNAIYKAVSSFVDSYNSTIDSAKDSGSRSVVSSASGMVSTTKANKQLLSDVGISIGSDNKLTIDEKAFKASNMSDVKSLFNSVGSYGYQVANSAAGIYNQSVSQLAQLSGSSYNNTGGYGGYTYSGSLYSSYL